MSQKSQINTYEYELLQENEKSIQINFPTKDKKKWYSFSIPKIGIDPKNPVIKKIVRKEVISEDGSRKKVVELTTDSYLFYKIMWLKIMKSMQEKGYKVKTWIPKEKEIESEIFRPK